MTAGDPWSWVRSPECPLSSTCSSFYSRLINDELYWQENQVLLMYGETMSSRGYLKAMLNVLRASTLHDICPINFDRYCAPIPEQYPRPLLPYQDPPGLGMRKTRELHGFEACPVSYRCHPGPPHPSVTPIRITPWIRPQTIIVRQHSHRHLHSGPLAICFCWFVTLNISSIPLTTPYCTLEARVC